LTEGEDWMRIKGMMRGGDNRPYKRELWKFGMVDLCLRPKRSTHARQHERCRFARPAVYRYRLSFC
jgi:hypothetical protein